MKFKDYKNIYPDNALFANTNKLLSLDADISVIQSIRNLGKSYDAMRLIKKAMDNGDNVAWLRWDKTELSISTEELNNFIPELKLINLKDSTARYLVNPETGVKCYLFPVKQASSFKGLDIPKLKWIVYDEFIPEFYDVKTRRDTEFLKFMSLYVTLKRNNNTRVILISNCIDWFNGYTKAWGIIPFEQGIIRVFTRKVLLDIDGKKVIAETKIAFENVKPSVAMIERTIKEESLKGDLESIKAYYQNVTKTQYHLIGKCPNSKIPLSHVQFRRGENYYSFRDFEGIKYFVKTGKRNGITTDVFNASDIKPDEVRRTDVGLIIEGWINRGICRFENGHVYNDFILGLWDYRKHL